MASTEDNEEKPSAPYKYGYPERLVTDFCYLGTSKAFRGEILNLVQSLTKDYETLRGLIRDNISQLRSAMPRFVDAKSEAGDQETGYDERVHFTDIQHLFGNAIASKQTLAALASGPKNPRLTKDSLGSMRQYEDMTRAMMALRSFSQQLEACGGGIGIPEKDRKEMTALSAKIADGTEEYISLMLGAEIDHMGKTPSR